MDHLNNKILEKLEFTNITEITVNYIFPIYKQELMGKKFLFCIFYIHYNLVNDT